MRLVNRIMLVDDSDAINELNRYYIEKLKLCEEILIHNNGLDAIKELKKSVEENKAFPNVILLDIKKPIMDGFEFLDEFEKFPIAFKMNCNIIMLTTSLNSNDEIKALSYEPIKGYYRKPISDVELQSILVASVS